MSYHFWEAHDKAVNNPNLFVGIVNSRSKKEKFTKLVNDRFYGQVELIFEQVYFPGTHSNNVYISPDKLEYISEIRMLFQGFNSK